MRQRGFTLVELMVTVAIIAVLAAVAIPQFTRTTRKSRASEVQAVFAEMHQRQQEYHFANGSYFSTSTTEATTFPTTPGAKAQSIASLPTSWVTLKVRPTYQNLYCGYVTIGGTAGDNTGIGTKANEFGLFTAPNTDWYYLLAHCNLDGNSSKDSYYFSWSGDPTVKKQNEGY